jgi:DNA-binding response OmpR family regulator
MKRKILIVEDDPDTVLALGVRLKSRGLEVLNARDVATGVSLARSHSPDAIILDLGPPDGDGYSLVEKLNASPATSSIPVIVLTAREPQLDLGVFAFFQKPVPHNWLLAAIERAFAQEPSPS